MSVCHIWSPVDPTCLEVLHIIDLAHLRMRVFQIITRLAPNLATPPIVWGIKCVHSSRLCISRMLSLLCFWIFPLAKKRKYIYSTMYLDLTYQIFCHCCFLKSNTNILDPMRHFPGDIFHFINRFNCNIGLQW